MKYSYASVLALALGSSYAAGVNISHEWTFNHISANGSKANGSEIVAYDALNDRLWVVGTDANTPSPQGLGGIDVLDLGGNLLHSVDTRSLGGINSVSVKNGQAAVAITAPLKTDPGLVRFYDTTTFAPVRDVTVGSNPDSLIHTPDGNRVLVANEGEPSSYLVPGGDPEGSVSIIDANSFSVQTADFNAFNGQADALRNAGVRLTGPNASVAQDVEPEYIAISADGTKAVATLQEANSVAIIDIASATVEAIQPMGLKDHSLAGNGLDASDRDGIGNNSLNGNIQNWNVSGMYMPDGVTGFTQNGQQYYATANEGDSRADWPGGNDEFRIGDLSAIDPALDAPMIAAHGADWKTNNDKLSRLNVSGAADIDADGDIDELQVFGGRSFSILDAGGNLIFDSGDQIERIISTSFPGLWDDGRSDNKGPEPENVTTGNVEGRDLLFVGLERSNAVMIWDLSNLGDIKFLDMMFAPGDVGPEGLSFFSNAEGSFLAVANEVSETTSLFRISVPAFDPSTILLLTPVVAGMCGFARLRRRA